MSALINEYTLSWSWYRRERPAKRAPRNRGRGKRSITALIDYLERLRDEVSAAFAAGRTLDETYALCTDPWATDLDPEFATALSEYEVPFELAERGFLELCRNLHRLNIMTTYRVCERLAA